MVGSAIWRALEARGDVELVGWTSGELDLTDRQATLDTARDARPDVVVLAAAKVGGIVANDTAPVEFLHDNLRIQANIMEAADAADVKRLLFLGSSCIYPRDAAQPMTPDMLLTGPLEPTNDAYAIAKLAGITAIRSYRREYGRAWISCLPTNLYGPGDSYDLETSHVLPALIRRFHEATVSGAPTVTLWGTGAPRREFLHVDDLAAACVRLLETTTMRRRSTSVRVRISPSPSSRPLSRTSSATEATSCGTPHGPTAHPASSSTSHPCERLAGNHGSRSRTASVALGRGTWRR
jgi:GDP-L-fucose synthase